MGAGIVKRSALRRLGLKGLGATALTGGLLLASVPYAAAASAEVTGEVTFDCVMPDFGDSADFVYDATVTLKGIREAEGSSPVTLVAQLSDMPGVVPHFISMKDQDVQVTLGVTVDGAAATLQTSGKTDVNPNNNGSAEAVVLPEDIQGTAASTAAEINVSLTTFEFVVAGVGGNCTATAGAQLDPITPEVGAAPAPAPTPTPTPKPTPTEEPEPTETADPEPKGSKGKPATGTIHFACTLGPPFNSDFDYEAKTSIAGARANDGDTAVDLSGSLGHLPGIAPVAIDGGQMSITVKGTVDDQPVQLTGHSTVHAAANANVAIPRLTGKVETSAVDAAVEITDFRFEFEEMAGLAISADCKAARGGDLGTMTIGVGSIDDVDPPGEGNGGGAGSGAGGAGTTLPRTGGGDAMPVIGLWALAFGMLGAGLLVWMPKQRRTTS